LPDGELLKTTDAGNNWIIVLQKPNSKFASIAANS